QAVLVRKQFKDRPGRLDAVPRFRQIGTALSALGIAETEERLPFAAAMTSSPKMIQRGSSLLLGEGVLVLPHVELTKINVQTVVLSAAPQRFLVCHEGWLIVALSLEEICQLD